MGCVTSKVLTRSSSVQEELKQRMWRSDKRFPVPRNGGDHQFLALICSPDEVPKILQSANYTPESGKKDIKPSIVEQMNPDTINTLELMTGHDQEKQEAPHRAEGPINVPKRSKSFDWSTGHDLSIQGSLLWMKEDGDNREVQRSRSFHTVEEYEYLLKAKSWGICCDDVEVKNRGNLGEESGVEVAESEVTSSCCSASFSTEIKEVSKKEDVSKEKGSRRKAMAKELTSLKIPSTFELPAVASLKEWIQVEEQVHSPGASATPKCGGFGLPVSMNRRNYSCSDDGSDSNTLFDPEMLSAFEEAMQRLQTEEECVLQFIEDEITSH